MLFHPTVIQKAMEAERHGIPSSYSCLSKALYTSSSARARAGSLLSDHIPVQRGVRQGCPLSGLLFNLFINDILDGVAPSQSWTIARHNPPSEDSVGDADLVWPSVASSAVTGHLAPRLDSPLDIRLLDSWSVVWSHTSTLVVLIDSKLDHSAWLNAGTVCTRAQHLSTSPSVVFDQPVTHVNDTDLVYLLPWAMAKPLCRLSWLVATSHTCTTPTTSQQGNPTVHWCPTATTAMWTRHRYWLTPQNQTTNVQATTLGCSDGDSASLKKYVTRQSMATSGFFKDPIDHCILCDQQLLSTSIAHLVVECEQVTGHRIQSGLVPAIQKSRLRLLGRALDPGVENVYTWLRGGVLNGEADLDQRWLDGTVEHESMGTRHDNRALAARLADFLQVAYRQYQSTLWKYHLGSPCGSWLTDSSTHQPMPEWVWLACV
ncbi:hypothetical protein BASA62_009376 [Batrachochytrium salamandrivorans]|nr:hypothetical protein BASA62_009376 [Batrachochytrium salamandrivorans]